MKKLRNFKDDQTFKISKKSKVCYKLIRLDKKEQSATYQSLNSNRTFESDWNKLVYGL